MRRLLLGNALLLAACGAGETFDSSADGGTTVIIDGGATSASDAGVETDAGTVSTDAGDIVTDAGAVDPGTPDAGPVDAGPVDAGPPPLDLVLSIRDARSTRVNVCIALFDNEPAFTSRAPSGAVLVACEPFASLPLRVQGLQEARDYALSFFLDENGNQALDTGFGGMPTEGFGFSNDPTIGFSAPSWRDVKFTFGPATANMSLHATYCSLADVGCK
jgi:uncharacterized protein (DUF2141 family)